MATIDALQPSAEDGSPDATDRIVVWPHRSLGRRGMITLLAAVGAGLGAAGVWAGVQGAWPIVLHVMLAFGALAFALRCNNGTARMMQVIEFAPDAIRVSESGPAASRKAVSEFNPYWVRVQDHPDPRAGRRLVLRQSGGMVEIGGFLSVEERAELAAELRRRIAARYHRSA
jgi:uncharacterized membrane protein